MQLALISDIHGNLVALDAILDEIARRNIKHVLCLGDVALGGPQPRQVIQRLREMHCPVVMGNTDAWLLHPQHKELIGPFAQYTHDIELWCAQQLSEDDKVFLRALPATFMWMFTERTTLLGYHGSPRSFREKVLPTTPDEALEQAFANTDAQIYAGGHTHIQMFRRYKDQLVINPGSVGMAMDRTFPITEIRNPPWGEYAILDIEEKGVSSIELCRVPFDVERLGAAMLQSHMPHADWAANRLLNS